MSRNRPETPPQDGVLRVLFCANPDYFPHVAVAAISVADNNPRRSIDFHLIACDRDAAAEALLRGSLAQFPNVDLHLHFADEAIISELFVDGFLTKECYLRIFAPWILPESIDRLIYLDSDLVVVDDLGPLMELDLGDNLVAAAPDYPLLRAMISPDRRKSLGIPVEHDYVNSGVLVMELSRWRRDRMTERLCRYIERQGARLSFHDQDAINAVLHDRIQLLDCRWNLQARMYACGRGSFPREFEATVEARRRPAIIHYTGSEKPWKFRSRIPRKGDYVRYQRKTAWRSAPATESLSGPQRLEFALDRGLSLIGIDYLQALRILRRAPAKLGETVGLLRAAKPEF